VQEVAVFSQVLRPLAEVAAQVLDKLGFVGWATIRSSLTNRWELLVDGPFAVTPEAFGMSPLLRAVKAAANLSKIFFSWRPEAFSSTLSFVGAMMFWYV
jgi:hypothetical protein